MADIAERTESLSQAALEQKKQSRWFLVRSTAVLF